MNTETSRDAKTVALVNSSTEKWPPRHRTYFGSLEVRSPEPGEPYAITPIRGCTGVIDMGDKRTMPIQITAREIAEDIARELNNDSGGGSFHGVFVAAGPQPAEPRAAKPGGNRSRAVAVSGNCPGQIKRAAIPRRPKSTCTGHACQAIEE